MTIKRDHFGHPTWHVARIGGHALARGTATQDDYDLYCRDLMVSVMHGDLSVNDMLELENWAQARLNLSNERRGR